MTVSDAASNRAEQTISVHIVEPAEDVPVLFLSPSNQPWNLYTGVSTNEREQMEALAALVRDRLTAYRVNVLLPDYDYEQARGWRTPGPLNEMAIKLEGRPTYAADQGADFYLALHSNATGNGTTAYGPLALYHPNSRLSKQMAISLVNQLNALNPPGGNTGGGIRDGMNAFGGNGYGEIRSPMMLGVPSSLLEVNFHDNSLTANYIVNNKSKLADAITAAVVQTMNLSYKNESTGSGGGAGGAGSISDPNIPILNGPTATQAQARAWAQAKGAAGWFIEQIPTFWSVSQAAGVDPAVTYAQAGLETGYGKYTGVVTVDQHNTCGLKITRPSQYDLREDHARFDSWKTGITAHVDHLALYAGKSGYPLPYDTDVTFEDIVSIVPGYTPDPRHFSWLHGTAKTVKELGGKWAPSPTYGDRLSDLIKEMRRY
jgi:N-acetylmuramoyl-L-alanine amidase